MQADEFGGAFDQFFGEDKPVGGFSDYDQLIATLLDAFEADDSGAADGFDAIARGRVIGTEADLADEFAVEALDGNSPDDVRGAFGKSRKAGAVGFFADAQTLDGSQGFHGEDERQAREALLLATGEAPLARFFSEEAAVFGEERVAVEGMGFLDGSEFPKAGGRTEEEFYIRLPELQEIDECELVVEAKEPGIEIVEFIAHEVMERHAGVLGCTLDEPIEGEAFLNLELLGNHRGKAAFGGGVGRVFGQSGSKGSGSRSGCSAGRSGGSRVGSGCCGVGGARGSVWGIGESGSAVHCMVQVELDFANRRSAE